MKKIGISILGFGTIGCAVYTILTEQKEYIANTYGFEIEIRYILVKNIAKKRNVSDTVQLINDINCIINDTETSIVFECIGGKATDETFNMVLQLIRAKKNIIFSSKKCLAIHRKEIINETITNNVQIRYDATVGGGVPVFRLLDNLYGTNKVCKLYGIVNATTNYILSLIKEQGYGYETAKNTAIQKGLAENNPCEDLNGFDAMYKLIILLRFGLGIDGNYDDLKPNEFCKTYNNSSQKQIVYAEIGEYTGLYIGLADVKDTPMETINGKNNVVCLESLYGGTMCILGAGAGGLETAAVMIDDFIDILLFKRKIRKLLAEKKVKFLDQSQLSFNSSQL